ncbi:acyltransferase family protein [Soonwooa sp.]|uniref:acyltransferase family protein n=1 Tax=Soonwooa sp. TaxID=1938592 RepID=UPI00261A809E|nr:acyltransferase family protein [Soonwooa sp.]
MQSKGSFTLDDTNYFKGIAILLIVLHNYLHWQAGFSIENESDFSANNAIVFLSNLYPIKWPSFFVSIFSFLGHYGVQLFIFFSAYGLSIQFIKNENTSFNYFKYLKSRLKKLYFLLIFGFIVYHIFFYIGFGEFYSLKKTAVKSILLSSSISNFYKPWTYNMLSGPFWFFGLMVQLYVVFPFLFKILKKYKLVVILSVTYLLIILLYYMVDKQTSFNILPTLIGHLPEVFLGIYFAQNKWKKPSLLVFIISLIIFSVSQVYEFLFPFSFLAFTLVLLYTFESLYTVLGSFWKKIFISIGKVSMIIFVTNGIFRILPLFDIENMDIRAERIFLYLILLLPTCYLLYFIYNKIFEKIK